MLPSPRLPTGDPSRQRPLQALCGVSGGYAQSCSAAKEASTKQSSKPTVETSSTEKAETSQNSQAA
jgi:hypothetical protein